MDWRPFIIPLVVFFYYSGIASFPVNDLAFSNNPLRSIDLLGNPVAFSVSGSRLVG
jgi:hypothetical protein